MASRVKAYISALWIISYSAGLCAQSPPNQTARQSTSHPDVGIISTPRADASLLNERRTTALLLLQSLAHESRTYPDPALRLRIQARAADALWGVDKDRARELFRRAWETADSASVEAARRVEEDRRAQVIKYGAAAWSNPPDFHAEILRLVARRDDSLSKEFLAKLEEAKQQQSINDDASAQKNRLAEFLKPIVLPPHVAQQLKLAMNLLESGNSARALQIAEPALDRVSMEGITFLSALRGKNAPAADHRYAALLASAAADSTSDANTVSLLSSYAFTPFVYFTALPSGAKGISQSRASVPAPVLSHSLRSAFFHTALQILSRPHRTEQQQSPTGREGTYFLIERLLPYFEQYAPDMMALLHTQLNALRLDLQASAGATRPSPSAPPTEDAEKDDLQDALADISRAVGIAACDKAYANAALVASRKDDARARDFADRIDDKEVRDQVRAYVDMTGVNSALKRKEIEQGLRLARTGALTHLQRAWALTQLAHLLKKSDQARFLELLNEAAGGAHLISETDPDRVKLLVLVATKLAEVDPARTWDMMSEAVKIANDAPAFTGDDGSIITRVRTDDVIMMANYSVPDFNLAGIFQVLARHDFYRAMYLARGFKSESPRALATLAVASSVLHEQ